MPTLTTHRSPPSPPPSTLHVALDLGNRTWCLACARGVADPPRLRTLPARDLTRLHDELTLARRQLGLAAEAPVLLCYEAGRDGFWLYRACTAAGITAVVVDSSSIEVSRRARRAKTDRLDATALLRLLFRHAAGERGQWRVLHVPTVEEEDRRHAHRELARLTRERTRGVNQIKGLLAAHGIRLTTLQALPDQLTRLTQWDGQPLPAGVRDRLLTTWARLRLILTQRNALVRARRAWLAQANDPAIGMVRQLLRVRGVGEMSAWLLTMELFSWRRFRNRREVAGILGLGATPHSSGDRRRELGIGKGGSALLRGLALELAWCWLRYQPRSALSQWYRTRFAAGGSRQRRIGIVALARRLMIALWRYVETGQVPAGATMKA
ncbi:MAG: IS110 family transposase [Gemmatimonadaceae bacterium]